MLSDEITQRFEQALDDFIATDVDLLRFNADERAISHKLAEHIGKHFPEWNIDCEYNRIGKDQQKKLLHYSHDRFVEAKRAGMIPDFITTFNELQNSRYAVPVYPDIIVHQRGDRTTNLLIVEVKKSSNPDVMLGWDQWKIQFFRANLNYQVGVFISFNAGIASRQREDLIHIQEWFV
jgi:hypothetical protein